MLDGQTALITGASSGLGAHFARTLSEAGANVVLGARRLERVQALAASLESQGRGALAARLDVTSERSIAEAFAAAETRFGKVNIVVANAGSSAAGRSTDVELDAALSVVGTNFTGVFLTAREGARRMIAAGSRETGAGRIILIGSITARLTGHGDSVYAATKAGVAHLGRNLAREWVRQGINVNVIQPGYIRTELNGAWFDTAGGTAQIAGFHRRRLMDVEALDDLLLFLASPRSKWVTGAVVDVDDGQSL